MPLRRALSSPPQYLGSLLRRRYTRQSRCGSCKVPAEEWLQCTCCAARACKRCFAARVERICTCYGIVYALCPICARDQAFPLHELHRQLVDEVIATGDPCKVYENCVGGRATLVTPYDLDEHVFTLNAFDGDLRFYRELARC
ncbi:Hypothetical Protein FCC1311_048442 [Hondaea fermentalgiana]|uniref:Uncharacterized protein n=1 Tax=Hondaea fermentalgiana TaxID=2315210 RepID=A0A2R5GIZ2_9STRA|nr:Hypothetical Protein FCC1311_048442 [Hondaea fermentalgiana]|eukprot:GBG28623.1 Hypothetical Protein FCC1311_048442 [Hondaea fermentalgiana]